MYVDVFVCVCVRVCVIKREYFVIKETYKN